MLTKELIDSLPNSSEKVINKYISEISKEIAINAKSVGIQEARKQANIKYGKFWRNRLEIKKIYKKSIIGEMSYF